jgi:uncharacterized protein YdaU (DUF1376 family)
MSLPFMPMYWGDYWRDTGHLSDEEHVAYLKLISHYWQHESLPDDDARLARIAGRGQQEWQAMRGTLQAFFVDGWKHNRIEKELVKQKAVRQVSVDRATKAANARWNAPSIPQASSEQCSTNANQNHSHNHIQNNNHNHNKIIKRSTSLADFDRFWSCYPKRVGKGSAEKAWQKALSIASADEIISVVEVYPWGDDKQFIPHPATWLNQKRWQDDLTASKSRLESQAERLLQWAKDNENDQRSSIENSNDYSRLLSYSDSK